ncbi:MAG TPA: tannase/feruloyl esterase family alpha/beta hydrolase [Candidatus Nitrosopolaris sp.]|nr:tannase/feruloyl esterase family alpha/beta hydrolase [Candidatus Nitrosopolaris sp.]
MSRPIFLLARHQIGIAILLTALPAAVALAQVADTSPKPIFPDNAPVCPWESLTNVALPNTTIDSVVTNADGSCRVTATVTHPPSGDRVRVFIALPMQGWNGRFEGTGGGGFSGGSSSSLRGPVRQGFVAGATDTGHPGMTGSFGLDANGRLNWQAIENNAYLGIHDMTVVGKALTKAFYGKAPRYSYFVGFSTGGRQGLMEAQRYPEDYDGIVSGCPAINWHKFVLASLWPQVVMGSSSNFVSSAKLNAATAAAIAACDAMDGVTDGFIEDPSRCTYDPKALVGTQVGGSTFTEADADVIRKIWEGPRAHDGTFLWYGLSRGADLSALAGARPFPIPMDWVRYFLVQDPTWDVSNLTPAEFELLFKQSVEEYGAVFGTDNPDLPQFRDHGGKLIIMHGQADQLIMTQGTIDYYKRVMQQMGGRKKVMQFARLFLIPGAGHGNGGVGNGGVDAVIRWVEQGVAPDKLINRGPKDRTRPLFPYPELAKYKGRGSTDDADNFVSTLPAN